jgi:WD40 repeat protein
MPDVFISYSRKDSRYVGALADALRERGKDVWIDIEGIRDAEVFPEALRNAIGTSDGFVFIISPASVQSQFCMREVGDAVESGKRIVPVDLEHVPDDDVPEPIRVRNWIPAGDDLGTTVDRVVKALDTDLDHIKSHTHWELKALEWDQKDRDHSLLLRGGALTSAEAWLGPAEAKDPPPTPLQREYLTESRQAAANRQRRVAIVAVGVALVSIALLVFALIQRGQAQDARKTNESRAVAFASEAQNTVDPERALLMAMEATKTRATPDALFALRSALDANPLMRRYGGLGAQNCQQPAPGVSFRIDGAIAVGLCSGRVKLIGANGRALGSIVQQDPAAPLRFSPTGTTLAVAGNGRIRLYDAKTLAWKGELEVPGYPQRIVYSGDGTRIAATSANATRSWTSVWDAHTGRLTMRLSQPAPSNGLSPLVRGIGFVDGANALAIGSPTGPVTINASDGGRTLRTLPDKEDALIGFDPDGRYLVVGGFHTHGSHSRSGVVTVWDTFTWRPRVVATASGLRPRNIYVSPDASRVAVGWNDGSAGIYSLFVPGQLARFLGPPKPVSALAYSPDSKTVAVGAADGTVRIWRAGGSEEAYAEIGSRIDWDLPAPAGVVTTVLSPPNIVRTLSLPDLRPLTSKRIPLPPNTHFTNGYLSPSGTVAVMIRDDDRADAMDVQRGTQILSLPAFSGAVVAVDSRDRKMILLDGAHNELADLTTGALTPLRERARLCRGSWRAARFSDDGSLVVAGANCGELIAWNARTGKLVRRMALPGQITGLALGHDNRTAAVASPEGRVSVIDVRSGAQRQIPGAPRGINSLDFGAGDRLLAAGAADGVLRVWDVPSARLLREIPLQSTVAARFTPDGKMLLATQLTGALSLYKPCPGCGEKRVLLSEAARRVTRKLSDTERKTYLSGF